MPTGVCAHRLQDRRCRADKVTDAIEVRSSTGVRALIRRGSQFADGFCDTITDCSWSLTIVGQEVCHDA